MAKVAAQEMTHMCVYIYIYKYIHIHTYVRTLHYIYITFTLHCIALHYITLHYTHTLDKNGSLYDPAGTES